MAPIAYESYVDIEKRTRRRWRVAAISAAFSLSGMIAIELHSVPDPRDLGEMFAYNLGFFFPILTLSAVAALVASVNSMKVFRNLGYLPTPRRLPLAMLPVLFILPTICQLAFVLYKMAGL